MNVQAVRSDALYRKMMGAEQIEKENIYRNELMKPFEFKWMCVGIPLKAEIVGGFDVVSSAGMSGFYAPMQITEERCDEVQKISDDTFWNNCENSIVLSSNSPF